MLQLFHTQHTHSTADARDARGEVVQQHKSNNDNDKNPRDYLDRMYFDSLVHSPEMLDYLVKLAGAEHVALGTDYPFPLGELEPGKLIESMNYDEETKAKLLHGAALDWLGLEKSNFE